MITSSINKDSNSNNNLNLILSKSNVFLYTISSYLCTGPMRINKPNKTEKIIQTIFGILVLAMGFDIGRTFVKTYVN